MPFVLRIDQERCKGCALCIDVCAKKVLRISKQINRRGQRYAETVAADNCVGCKQCADICPDAAIEIDRINGAPKTEHRDAKT